MVPEDKRDLKFFIDNYQGGRCACGDAKASLLSFCKYCFFSLPEELRDGLQGPLHDEEYQWTWNKSYEFLKENGRISEK
jgi:hypothetical protein